jgi:hypothetical protein
MDERLQLKSSFTNTIHNDAPQTTYRSVFVN